MTLIIGKGRRNFAPGNQWILQPVSVICRDMCRFLVKVFFFCHWVEALCESSKMNFYAVLFVLPQPIGFLGKISQLGSSHCIYVFSRMTSFGIEDFAKKYGTLKPAQFVDIISLVGDRADNIPGFLFTLYTFKSYSLCPSHFFTLLYCSTCILRRI